MAGGSEAGPSRRVAGVDVARAVASLVMIQGHAYHGWVAPEHRDTAYAFTRVLGTLPLPSFLVLAGAAMTMRLRAAVQKGERAGDVRRALVRRGLQVFGYGYAVNLAYGLLDGGLDLPTLLRADVLHVIGLSIAAAAAWGVRPDGAGAPDLGRFARRSAGLALAVTLVCPFLSALTPGTPTPLGFAVALVADVPPYTRMPFVPLAAWLGVGVATTVVLLRAADDSPFAAVAGSSRRALAIAALGGLGVALAGDALTELVVGGDRLSRAHVAVWPNVLAYAGRGVLVLAAGMALAPALGPRTRAALTQLGRGTLLAYIVHVPFCYGRLAGDLLGTQTMAGATLWLVPLMAGSWLVVPLRDMLRERRRAARLALAAVLLAALAGCEGEAPAQAERPPPAEAPPADPGELPERERPLPGYPYVEAGDRLLAPARYDHLVPRLVPPIGPRFANLVYDANNVAMRGARREDGFYEDSGDTIAERWRVATAGTRKTFALRDALFSQQDHPIDHDPVAVMPPLGWVTVAVAAAMTGEALRPPQAPPLDDDEAWAAIPTPRALFGSFPPSERLHEEATKPRGVLAPQRLRVSNARRSVRMLAAAGAAMARAASEGPEAAAQEGARQITASDLRYFGERLRREHLVLSVVENPNRHERNEEAKGFAVAGRELPEEAIALARRTVLAARLGQGDIALERYHLLREEERDRAIAALRELVPRRGPSVEGGNVWVWVHLGMDAQGLRGPDAARSAQLFRSELAVHGVDLRRVTIVPRPPVPIGGSRLAMKLNAQSKRYDEMNVPLSLNLATPILERLIDINEERAREARARARARAAATE
ncbi:MAG: heparan-alpha-glucosaminide N-acetyltransferase domain-containing protein [Myxococcota bacterium]